MNNKAKEIGKWLIAIMVPFITVYFLLNIVFGIVEVSGSSMEPALSSGDKVIISRLSSDYRRGDIVVINEKDHYTIKRIVAFENEIVNVAGGTVYINGESLEDFSDIPTYEQTVSFPHTVSEKSYFVLGDNRVSSLDSRYIEVGDIPESQIIGKVIFLSRNK